MREESFSGISAFLLVAQKQSFSAAASVMGVTPSAISQHIKQLEERLGVRLLQRTTRRVGLTEAGERLRQRVRPAIAEVSAALQELGELQDTPSGNLRLNVSRIGLSMIIEPLLASFMERFPDINVELVIEDALTGLVEGNFDAGLRLGERLEPGMIGVKVGGDLSLAVVGAPSYFAKHKAPKHPSELHQHDCIRFRRMPSGVVYKWEFVEEGRELEVATTGRLVVNDSSALIRAAVSGIGLAQVFTEAVTEEIAQGRLVRVLARFSEPFAGFYLYYQSRAQAPLKLKVFVEFVKEFFQPKKKPSKKTKL
jgi:DNA-binding transcriptional LysR family regulator